MPQELLSIPDFSARVSGWDAAVQYIVDQLILAFANYNIAIVIGDTATGSAITITECDANGVPTGQDFELRIKLCNSGTMDDSDNGNLIPVTGTVFAITSGYDFSMASDGGVIEVQVQNAVEAEQMELRLGPPPHAGTRYANYNNSVAFEHMDP